MAYINGKEVLPEELLKEIQKQFKGGIIYIPDTDETRKPGGSNTETKRILDKRNFEIRTKKLSGVSIKELMEEYHLSYDSIKKILYCT